MIDLTINSQLTGAADPKIPLGEKSVTAVTLFGFSCIAVDTGKVVLHWSLACQ